MYLIRNILRGKSTPGRVIQLNIIPIELHGQGIFAPMEKIYCLVLWLIQQPIPLPEQPCWSSQGHLKTDAWLIIKISEPCSWCAGSVAKHEPFRHLLLPFCHLFLERTSCALPHLTDGQLASKQQSSTNDCLQTPWHGGITEQPQSKNLSSGELLVTEDKRRQRTTCGFQRRDGRAVRSC